MSIPYSLVTVGAPVSSVESWCLRGCFCISFSCSISCAIGSGSGVVGIWPLVVDLLRSKTGVFSDGGGGGGGSGGGGGGGGAGAPVAGGALWVKKCYLASIDVAWSMAHSFACSFIHSHKLIIGYFPTCAGLLARSFVRSLAPRADLDESAHAQQFTCLGCEGVNGTDCSYPECDGRSRLI